MRIKSNASRVGVAVLAVAGALASCVPAPAMAEDVEHAIIRCAVLSGSVHAMGVEYGEAATDTEKEAVQSTQTRVLQNNPDIREFYENTATATDKGIDPLTAIKAAFAICVHQHTGEEL